LEDRVKKKKGILGILPLGPVRSAIRDMLQGESVRFEDKIEEWRARGIPEPIIETAIQMADEWVEGQYKAIKEKRFERGLESVAPPGTKPKKERIERYRKRFLG